MWALYPLGLRGEQENAGNSFFVLQFSSGRLIILDLEMSDFVVKIKTNKAAVTLGRYATCQE